MRSLRSQYSAKLADKPTSPSEATMERIWHHGAPILMPGAWASLLRAMARPSLLSSATTGWPRRPGRNTLSQLF